MAFCSPWLRTVTFLLMVLPLTSSETVQTKVLVLGAGMAGISAAQNLSQSGLTDFVILEGSGRVGGRLKSVKFGGKTIEIGAQTVNGLSNKNPIWAMAQKYNMSGSITSWAIKARNSTGHDVSSQVETVLYKTIARHAVYAYNLAVKRNASGQPDMPVRAALSLAGWKPTSFIEKVVEYIRFDWYYGENPDVSSLMATALDPTPLTFGIDDYFITDQRGYGHIIERMAESFLTQDDQRLKLNKPVTMIQWDDNGVTVETKDGSRYTAEYAIVTFSMGVLQGNSVRFVPGLPDWKREVIFQVHMALDITISMKFPFRFWDDDGYIVFIGGRVGRYTWWENIEADGVFPEGTNILQVTLVDEEARRVEAQSDDVTQAEIMEVLRSMYGDAIPDPLDILVPRWGQDPFYRGSYANPGVGIIGEEQRKLQAAVAGRLFFAGDGTGPHQGYVQGAYFEGTRVADTIVKCMSGGPCEEEYQPPRRGCTCPSANNFDSQATVDDGSCSYTKSGGNGLIPFL